MNGNPALTTGLLLAALASGTSAQSAEGAGPDAGMVAWVDGLAARRGAEAVRVRWDGETGTFASLTLEGGRPLLDDDPAAAAATWIEADLLPLLDEDLRAARPGVLGLGSGRALAVGSTRDLGRGRILVTLPQAAGGLAVLDAGLRVELERTPAGLVPRRVAARYHRGIPTDLARDLDPAVEAALPERFPAWIDEAADLHAETRWEPVVAPADGAFRAAWAVTATTAGQDGAPPATWRVLVDGATGEELDRTKLSCEAVAQGLAYDENPQDTPRALRRLPGLYVFQGQDRVTTDAMGEHALTGMVSLDDGLAGPLARVFVSGEEELAYTGPADVTLQPQGAEAAQDELAAFYHVADYNDHLQDTYPLFAVSQAVQTRFAVVVRFQQNGQPVQNAFFTPQNVTAGGEPFTGYIGMGTFGGREAAKSGSVMKHEYSHALYSEVVSLNGSLQATGINEGLADYLPAVAHEDPRMGPWLTVQPIRDLTRDYVWPQDDNGDPHRVGHILAGALWDARTAAEAATPDGRLAVDQAVVEGLFRLRDRPDLIDAREAILEGDRVANGGAWRVTITTALNDHGIGPAAQNDEPALDALADASVTVGDSLVVTVQGADPDGDPLRYSASPLPNAATDPATGEWTFTPDASQVGVHQVTFTGSDEELSDSATIAVTVDPAPGPTGPVGPGGISPTTSTATPGALGAAPAPGGGGGGGGGCALVAGDGAGAPIAAWALLLLTLGALRLRRERA